jgi:CRISPR-associated protein Cmr1
MSGVAEIVARYRVVTPLFCGGADPTTAAELRLPSFKGVLRFWWRALAWSYYQADLTKIHAAENDLFGSGGAGARRSRVVMRLGTASGYAQRAKGAVLQDANGQIVGHGARYLGYGLMEAFDRGDLQAGQLSRACLVEARRGVPFEFEVHLRCRGVDPPVLELLQRGLEIMGTVGGLGARSRRGYGSLALTGLTSDGSSEWKPPTSIAELKERIATLTVPTRSQLPEYTAFSEGSRHVLLHASNCSDPLALLDRVGREMVHHRSFGNNGMVLASRQGRGVQAEQNFRDDHDWMQNVAAGGGPPPSHPERIAFGLPHNYYFSHNPRGRQKAFVGPGDGPDRRASPLLIHVHICDASPVVVLSFLPAQFLPYDTRGRRTIKVGGHRVPQVPEPQLYKAIHDFLDRFGGPRGKESFSHFEVHP